MLLEKYTGLKIPASFNVHMTSEPKEITAKGALLGNMLKPNFQIPAGKLQEIVDYGFDTASNLVYDDAVKKDEVRQSVIEEYEKFVDSLNDRDFTNLLYSRFGLSMPTGLFGKLKTLAGSSYTDVSAGVSPQHYGLDVKETLFFWPLKFALSKL